MLGRDKVFDHIHMLLQEALLLGLMVVCRSLIEFWEARVLL